MAGKTADVAEAVVARRKAGDTSTISHSVTCDLTEYGMCSRFVRLCHLAAGLPTNLFGASATITGENLRDAGKKVLSPRRGDITVFTGGPYGHIALYLGYGQYAENTSSGKRGDPRKRGTKISSADAIGTSRVWGHFSLQPAAYELHVIAAAQGTEYVIPCHPKVENNVLRGDLRAVVEALGWTVDASHLSETGRVYIKPDSP